MNGRRSDEPRRQTWPLLSERHPTLQTTKPQVEAGARDSPSLYKRTLPRTPSNTARREIVISHALWQRWFGGDRGVIGQTLEVQGRVPLTITGVMPPGFGFPREAEFWKPQAWQRSFGRGDPARWRQAIGRARPSISVAAAERELQRIEAQLGREFPATNAGWTAVVDPLAKAINGAVRAPLGALLAAVSLVFLLACVNVATLVLQRGLGRQREMATRLALGAGTKRLVWESLMEHGALAVGGLVAGGFIAFLILRAPACCRCCRSLDFLVNRASSMHCISTPAARSPGRSSCASSCPSAGDKQPSPLVGVAGRVKFRVDLS